MMCIVPIYCQGIYLYLYTKYLNTKIGNTKKEYNKSINYYNGNILRKHISRLLRDTETLYPIYY